MYDDIIHLAMDQQLLTEIKERDSNYKKLPLWKELQKTDDLTDLEKKLTEEKQLTFDHIFHEPVGYHLIKSFLESEHSVDKAVFLQDVAVYKTLQDPHARQQVAEKIFQQFCSPETIARKKGMSVFEKSEQRRQTQPKDDEQQLLPSQTKPTLDDDYRLSLITENTNSIGVYGRPIRKLREQLDVNEISKDIFNDISEEVYNDLRLDAFPRFCRSSFYNMYLRCKTIELNLVTVRDFYQMRMLGRGAFGCVNACKKRDTGKLYAMKQINKKRVQATESAEAIMYERNFLADMDSKFVTVLKYAFMDDTTLYLILDLMIGGDLKYHLNNEKIFSEDRSRFYAAEVLLGLEHIHSKGIIYRDLKLENVLVDDRGHCKISDLGLAVRIADDRVKGYAGTPGYTAPEVVLSHSYDHIVDFFSFGVMIYRFLCGKKPFQLKRHRDNKHDNPNEVEEDQKRRTTELDRNVVEMEPDYPSQYFTPEVKSLLKGLLCKDAHKRLGAININEIKQHPWFDTIDFGLLEAGYLEPPFVPPLDEIHAEQQQNIGRPPQDDKYNKIKIKPEFEESLKNFSYISKRVIQEEIVQVLNKVQHERKLLQTEEIENGGGGRTYAGSSAIPFDFSDSDLPRNSGDSCLGRCIIS